MSKVGSTSLKLIEKSYKSDIKGEWGNTNIKQIIFTQLYLEKKYSKLLHTVPWLKLSLDTLEYNYGFGVNSSSSRYYEVKDDEHKVHLADWNIKYNYEVDKENISEITHFIKIYKDTDKRYTFYPAGTYLYRDDIIKEGHSIFFLYDKKYNQVEMFDSIRSDTWHFRKNIKLFFTKIYGNNVKIIYPDSKIQTIGELYEIKCENKVYNYTAIGFCVIWSLWYLEMILTNPKLNFDQLKNKTIKLLKTDKDKVCKIPIGYAQFIDKLTEKYDIKYNGKSSKIILKNNGNRINIPKVLIGILGTIGAILYIIKKFNNKTKKI
jgi:hypothetical protein